MFSLLQRSLCLFIVATTHGWPGKLSQAGTFWIVNLLVIGFLSNDYSWNVQDSVIGLVVSCDIDQYLEVCQN